MDKGRAQGAPRVWQGVLCRLHAPSQRREGQPVQRPVQPRRGARGGADAPGARAGRGDRPPRVVHAHPRQRAGCEHHHAGRRRREGYARHRDELGRARRRVRDEGACAAVSDRGEEEDDCEDAGQEGLPLQGPVRGSQGQGRERQVHVREELAHVFRGPQEDNALRHGDMGLHLRGQVQRLGEQHEVDNRARRGVREDEDEGQDVDGGELRLLRAALQR